MLALRLALAALQGSSTVIRDLLFTTGLVMQWECKLVPVSLPLKLEGS